MIITCYRCLDLTCRLFISWDYLYVSTYSPEPTVTQYVNSELAQAVDVMMARAKRIYISIIKVNKSFSSFPSRCFLREIENMLSMFLSSCRKTRESLGELEKATAFLILPNFHSCFYNLIETRYMFSVS